MASGDNGDSPSKAAIPAMGWGRAAATGLGGWGRGYNKLTEITS